MEEEGYVRSERGGGIPSRISLSVVNGMEERGGEAKGVGDGGNDAGMGGGERGIVKVGKVVGGPWVEREC